MSRVNTLNVQQTLAQIKPGSPTFGRNVCSVEDIYEDIDVVKLSTTGKLMSCTAMRGKGVLQGY